MRRPKLITLIATAVVAVIIVAGLEYFEYPFPPKTLSLNSVNKITGENWTLSHVSTSTYNSWNNTVKVRETSGWYGSQNYGIGQELSFFIFQCGNDSQPMVFLHTFYKFQDNSSFGTNMTKEGDIYYNYTIAYLNNGPLYTQISSYYKNFYIMFVTPPDGSGPILSKTVMLNALNAQIRLLNESNPYFYNW